jgi:hypothetical protein
MYEPVDAGPLYVVAEGVGNGSLTVSGELKLNGRCDPAQPWLVCPGPSQCLPQGTHHTCRVPRCRDGIDNDGVNGKDYPADPGCSEPGDDEEAVPTPWPQCSNNANDDTDPQQDYGGDLNCLSPGDTSEKYCGTLLAASTLPIRVTGNTFGAIRSVSQTCGVNSGRSQRMYDFVAPITGLYQFVTRAYGPFPSEVWLSLRQGTCQGSELACGKRPSNENPVTTTVVSLQAGQHIIVVVEPQSEGSLFELSIDQVACDNGRSDGDGDTLADWPADPGCDSPYDTDETDPLVPPVCANGKDDDKDNKTDHAGGDLGCASASDPSEATTYCNQNATPVETLSLSPSSFPLRVGGETSGDSQVFFYCGDYGTPEKLIHFVAPTPGTYEFKVVQATFQPMLVGARMSCGPFPSAGGCSTGINLPLNVTLPLEDSSLEFILAVEGAAPGQSGSFVLEINKKP